MSQIEIRILKQGTETKKVISCSFFTMQDAYRESEKYVKNLADMLDQAYTDRPEFCVRVYTDDSGKDIALELAKPYDKVTVYHYNFEPLRENVGHDGTFGTLVRFLPLFEKGLDIVWVSDIDISKWWFDNIPKKDFNYKTIITYEEKPYSRKYTILANSIVSRITFPKQLLTKFLNNLADGKLSDMVDLLNEASKDRKPYSEIPYGIDEVFLNTSLYNYLNRHNPTISVEYDYLTGLENFLIYSGNLTSDEISSLKGFYITHSVKDFNKVKIILKKHLPWAVSKKPVFEKTLSLLPTFKTSFVKTYVLEGKELE